MSSGAKHIYMVCFLLCSSVFLLFVLFFHNVVTEICQSTGKLLSMCSTVTVIYFLFCVCCLSNVLHVVTAVA